MTTIAPSLSIGTRLAALVMSVVASTVVIGATVLGMQPGYEGASMPLIALDTVTVTATKVN
jgi:hypothetical protein